MDKPNFHKHVNKDFKPNVVKNEDGTASINNAYRKIDLLEMKDIPDRPQEWLWEGFIPYEACTLIAGQPGIGKSQFLAWLAAQVSNGAEFKLNGLPQRMEQGAVLILACEDNFETALKPRLKAVNANLENIKVTMYALEKGEKRKLIALDLESDLTELDRIIEKIGNVKLIIFDPVSAFAGNLKDHVEAQVRAFICLLTEFAIKHKLAIVLNKHLRKQQESQDTTSAISQVSGSGAWIAAVRQSFLIAPWHEDQEKILFVNLKVNIHKKQKEAFAYQIVGHQYTSSNGELIKTSHIQWCNEKITITADEAASKTTYERKNAGNAAEDFILDFMRKKTELFKLDQISTKCFLREDIELAYFKQYPNSMTSKTFRRAAENLFESKKIGGQLRSDRRWEYWLFE